MTHLMVDLETMGNKPNAAIVAIGAVFFEPSTGAIGEKFYSTVSLESDVAAGAEITPSTVLWWMTQTTEARAEIVTAKASILVALTQLKMFVDERCQGNRNIQIWGNGASFDNVILRQAYERINQPAFWPFWMDRDVRTIVELGRQIGIDPKRNIPFPGERHNALDDAIHQAMYVSAIWQKLIPNADEI